MHSAVMQNKKYIAFAAENTVEVLCLSSLDAAVQKKDPKAATYKRDKKDYMVQWPSLTYDQIIALSQTKELREYNDSGYIPYTCIVDPYTGKKLGFGYRDAASIIEAVGKLKSEMKTKGPGFAEQLAEAVAPAGQGEFYKALNAVKKVKVKGRVSKAVKEKLDARVDAATERIIEMAKAKVEETIALPTEEAIPALEKLIPHLRGTKLDLDAKRKLRELQKAADSDKGE
ncbi:MAG: hypothetical protein R3F20_13370 [Planctomycetota bacterium]